MDIREIELQEALGEMRPSEDAELYIEQVLGAEDDGYIVDLPTGEAFSQRTNWQAFTNHWMDMRWHMYQDANHNVLAATMRQVDERDGENFEEEAFYFELALRHQEIYFAFH